MGEWVGDEDVNLDGREEDTVHIQSGEKTVCSPGSEIMNTDTLCCTMQIFQKLVFWQIVGYCRGQTCKFSADSEKVYAKIK